MLKFQCLLSVLKRSYICYCTICMTVPLKLKKKFHKYLITYMIHSKLRKRERIGSNKANSFVH